MSSESSSQHLPDEEALAALGASVILSYGVWIAAIVMIWDIVIHMADDVELLFLPRRSRPPTVVYFLSRFFFLVYSFLLIAGDATNYKPPTTLLASVTILIALVFTQFQFFLRVRVIYCEDSRLKTGFFAALWVIASGCVCLTVAFYGHTAVHPVDFSYWVPILAILVHDTCVFLAISYKIYKLSLVLVCTNPQFNPPGVTVESSGGPGGVRPSLIQSLKARALALAGRELPSFTRAILHDGQFYYLISLASGVVTLSVMLNTSLPYTDRLLLVPIHTVLVNVTTGYVFREVKLGRMRERELTLVFQQSKAGETLPLHSIVHHHVEEERDPS
ncbi:hypothetical protein BDP27DRAFT_1419717 [Rhodocollybia butyracea]|uniref:Uncharacterized protein n=1 Tax=Rhodocollybia butyracea TaxID=206335 RepID=A0A9P5U887_9AGAR|nr:hypothetical protein BDP27DRAFT_1419717 [Rhodocollybia butyracea]